MQVMAFQRIMGWLIAAVLIMKCGIAAAEWLNSLQQVVM